MFSLDPKENIHDFRHVHPETGINSLNVDVEIKCQYTMTTRNYMYVHVNWNNLTALNQGIFPTGIITQYFFRIAIYLHVNESSSKQEYSLPCTA